MRENSPQRYRSALIALALFVPLLVGNMAWADTRPRVVSSVKPVQLILAAVADGLVENHLLVDANLSPHEYQMRPSDRFKLQRADLILWVGADLEAFLARPLATLEKKIAVVSLMEVPGLTLLKLPDSETYDPHLWLDPKNAMLIARHLAGVLAKLDPANAVIYQARAEGFGKRVERLTAEILALAVPYQQKPFAVMHDDMRYFTEHFSLSPPLVVMDDESGIGARSLLAVIRQLDSNKEMQCLLQQRELVDLLPDEISNRSGLKIREIDALASSAKESANAYEVFLRGFADKVFSCLADK